MNEGKNSFSFDERKLADEIADEILTIKDDKENRLYFFLVLLFLCCLIFLVSSISFAVFDSYYNGGFSNSVDVGVNVEVTPCDKNCDTDGDGICDLNCDSSSNNEGGTNNDFLDNNNHNTNVTNNGNSNNDNNSNNGNNNIVTCTKNCDTDGDGICDKNCDSDPPDMFGSVLFSFNEGANYINMDNVLPTSDSVGKNLTGDKQYFDFNVSASMKNVKGTKLIYEISLVPTANNTISADDVRVFLTENDKEVSVTNSKVNNFSDLPNSSIHKNAKVIYRKTVSNKYSANYIFRMWLSDKAKVGAVSKKFGCKVSVDAYQK